MLRPRVYAAVTNCVAKQQQESVNKEKKKKENLLRVMLSFAQIVKQS